MTGNPYLRYYLVEAANCWDRDSESSVAEEEAPSVAISVSCVVSVPRFLRASNQKIVRPPLLSERSRSSENPKVMRCQKCQKGV